MSSYFPVLGLLSAVSQGSLVPLERMRSRKQVVRVRRCAQGLSLRPGPSADRAREQECTWTTIRLA